MALDAAGFDARADALVRAEFSASPGEARYFLSHRGRFRRDFATLAASWRGGRLLEVGAYPFFFTALLKQSGLPVAALDLAPERLAPLIARHGLDVQACDIEAERWPFAEASFDYALFTELLEHLRVDPLFALAELNRVLKPGGLLLLTTPNLYAIKTVLRFALGRGLWDPLAEFGKLRRLGHMGHVREYARRDVLRLLAASGFRPVRAEYVQYSFPGVLGRAARPLLGLVPPLRSHQLVLAEKVASAPPLEPLPKRRAGEAPGCGFLSDGVSR